jgi:hypothetical protein
LLSQSWLRISGVLCLLTAYNVGHLSSAEDHTRIDNGLEAEHRPYPPFDGTVILLNAIIEASAPPDGDQRQLAARLILESICRVTGLFLPRFGRHL